MTIARAQGTDDQLVHKFAGEVTAGAPLTVSPTDAAIFFHNGVVTRVIGPGQYQVPPEFAGFGVEAFFVRTAPLPVKFGGPIPQRPGGPRMVFGEVQVQSTDPVQVVAQLVGSGDPAGAMDWVRRELQSAATSSMASSPEQLQAELVSGASQRLGQFGIQVVGVLSLTMK